MTRIFNRLFTYWAKLASTPGAAPRINQELLTRGDNSCLSRDNSVAIRLEGSLVSYVGIDMTLCNTTLIIHNHSI